MLDLKQLYKIIQWSNEQQDRQVGESVCIVIVPPESIASQFPAEGKEGEDTSPPHVTVAYLGTIAKELEDKVAKIAQVACQGIKPFHVKLGKMDKFENEKHSVYHVQIKSHKLHKFRDQLKHALAMGHMTIDAKHPDFRPHITIEYVARETEPKFIDKSYEGEWLVENAWLWGLSEPYLLQFK